MIDTPSEYSEFESSTKHSHNGFCNMIKLCIYMSVYFVNRLDKEFAKEWAFMVADPSFHMPRTQHEWEMFMEFHRR